MLPFKILTPEDYKRLTWKNGLGHTDEIAIYPPHALLQKGDFLWRISSAKIVQASPFSVFPDHDRFIVVLEGGGIRLTHTFEVGGAEDTVDLPPMNAYEFPGDIPSRCELTSGPITDLSVFVRKGEAMAELGCETVSEGEAFHWTLNGRWNFAFVASGALEVEGRTLTRGNTYFAELSPSITELPTVTLSSRDGPAKIVFICIQA